MAKVGELKLNVEVSQVRIIFFPVATYAKCGDIVKVTCFGVPVYERAGDKRRICGVVF